MISSFLRRPRIQRNEKDSEETEPTFIHPLLSQNRFFHIIKALRHFAIARSLTMNC